MILGEIMTSLFSFMGESEEVRASKIVFCLSKRTIVMEVNSTEHTHKSSSFSWVVYVEYIMACSSWTFGGKEKEENLRYDVRKDDELEHRVQEAEERKFQHKPRTWVLSLLSLVLHEHRVRSSHTHSLS